MAVAKEQIRQIISQNNINSVSDVYSLLKESFKDILQELMEAELDATLGYEKNQKGGLLTDNKRNGHSPKTLKSQYGEFQLDVPRDRNGEFEPKLIPKYQRDISGMEEKVISLYARGMSTRDIHDQINDLYGVELSDEMVSKITDKILPQVKEVSAKYSCGFTDPQVSPIIVVDRYLDYFTTIMEDRLWQVLAKPVFRWRNRSGLSMTAARAA